MGSLEKINKLHLSKHSDIQSIPSRDFHDFDKYSNNEKLNYNSYDREKVHPEIDHSEKLKETASFGKTYEKKNVKIATSQDEINPTMQLSAKTPHVKSIKNISPMKVGL